MPNHKRDLARRWFLAVTCPPGKYRAKSPQLSIAENLEIRVALSDGIPHEIGVSAQTLAQIAPQATSQGADHQTNSLKFTQKERKLRSRGIPAEYDEVLSNCHHQNSFRCTTYLQWCSVGRLAGSAIGGGAWHKRHTRTQTFLKARLVQPCRLIVI